MRKKKDDKPRRRPPPKRLKNAVRKRQDNRCGCRTGECGRPELPPDGKGLVHYQHDPALGVRPVREDGTDWIPPQHDPDHLYAELQECHDRETYDGRSGATSLGSDRHAIDKVDRITGTSTKRKTKWAKGRKLHGRSTWGKRKWPSVKK